MRSIQGMSVLVTGGGTGIGLGTAERFAESGALVTITGRREQLLRESAERIGSRCRAVPGDVTIAEDRCRMVEGAVDHGGGLDALLNLAANMYAGPITELEEDRLLDLFHGNVVAGMMLVQLAKPYLADRKGCVVFAGSVHTQRAFPGASPYAATKGAIEVLTGVLAAELGRDGIRVSCIRPGAVHTDLIVRSGMVETNQDALERLAGLVPAHALDRIGTAEEIAEAIEYLVRADWTTGNVLTVDGGLGLGVTQT